MAKYMEVQNQLSAIHGLFKNGEPECGLLLLTFDKDKNLRAEFFKASEEHEELHSVGPYDDGYSPDEVQWYIDQRGDYAWYAAWFSGTSIAEFDWFFYNRLETFENSLSI